MLIGIDKLLNLCNYFLEDNFENFENVGLGTDFFCYPNTAEIYIAIVALQDALDEFYENLLTRTNIDDISCFTWSFLHEVGHCMTWNYLGKRTNNHCRNIKRKIQRGSIDTQMYYRLADEKMATDWAINYVSQNYNLVKAFDKNALQILTEIFIENEIDLEE